jgi:hypothetical protein
MSFAKTVPPGPTIPPSGNFSSLNVGGIIDMNDAVIKNVGDPIDAKDAANKEYVDTHGGGGGTGLPNSVAYYDSLGQSGSIVQVKSNGNNNLTIGSDLTWFQGPKISAFPNAIFSQQNPSVTGGDYVITGDGYNNQAFVYKKINGTWTFSATLSPSNPIGNAEFGSGLSILINGTTVTVVVGGAQDNNIGASWIFQSINNSPWTQLAKIIPNDNIGSPDFGIYSSIVYNSVSNLYTLSIAGPSDDTNIGANWIYQSPDAISWTKIIKIIPDDNIGIAKFGTSTSLVNSDNTYVVAIGGPEDNGSIGAAWIYRSTTGGGSGWTKIVKIIPTDNIGFPQFGFGLSLDLTNTNYTVAIGGPVDNGGIGALWLYTSINNGSTWTELTKIIPADALGPTSVFGCSVAIKGSNMIVGGYGDNTFIGAGWLYDYNGTNWILVSKIVPINTVGPSSYVGFFCCIAENRFVLGGFADNLGVGSCWIYEYESSLVSISDGNIDTPGTITASILSDGYGSYINGGLVLAKNLSDGVMSISGGIVRYMTITDPSNNVAAKSLVSSNGLVNVDTTTPTTGQFLIATSDTVATWQTLPAPTPGGYDTQIQYNKEGVLTGGPNLTYNETNLDVSAWTQLTTLTGTESTFGTAISIDGTFAMVGSSANNALQGAVYVYQRNGNYWTLFDTLTATGGVGTPSFGSSVSLVGNLAVIGAQLDNSIGAVYAFEYTGGVWSQIARFFPPDNIGNSLFGDSIAMYFAGGLHTVAIGGKDDNGTVGAVWIYQSADGGNTWSEIIKIIPTNVIGVVANFGHDVSIGYIGTTYTVMIGGLLDNSNAGAVWVYQGINNGTTSGDWTEVTKILGANADKFGSSVSLYGDGTSTYTSVIGAYNAAGTVGLAYVYKSINSGTTWTQTNILTPVGITNFNLGFGWSSVIYDRVIIIASFQFAYNWMFKNVDTDVWEFDTRLHPISNSSGSSVGLTKLNGIYTSMIGYAGNPGNGNAYGYDLLITDVTGTVNSNGYNVATNSLATVTTDFTADFIFNGRQGVITLTPITMATGAVQNQSITNNYVKANSLIFVSMLEVGGITNCFSVNATGVINGAFDINICNVGPPVAAVTLKIAVLVISPV